METLIWRLNGDYICTALYFAYILQNIMPFSMSYKGIYIYREREREERERRESERDREGSVIEREPSK